MRSHRKGLSLPQFRTLAMVDQQPAASLSAVAAHLGCSLSAASRCVGGLVDRGFLARTGCHADRRQMALTMTARGRAVLQASRSCPATPGAVAALAPAGVVQATTVGMAASDGPPFPDLLEAAGRTASWAVEWIYKEDTAFAAWARALGLRLVPGAVLFEAQARAQSRYSFSVALK